MVIFRILFPLLAVIGAAAVLVVLFFFLWGLTDGTVGADNILLWIPLVGVPAAVLYFGLRLGLRGRREAGSVILLALAVPAVLLGLFFLVLIVAAPNWR